MKKAPPKPGHAPAPQSFEQRAAWARELGRCDAFDGVLSIWESADAELSVIRAERERELRVANAGARARTIKTAAIGVLALLGLAIPVASVAHFSTRTDVSARIDSLASSLGPLQHDESRGVTR